MRRRATVRRILAAGGAALIVSTLLTGTSSADTFSNTTPIVIPSPPRPDGCPPNCPAVTATPYPSEIQVTGVSGAITDVNVVLKDLTHDGPADLDVMLEAPDGKTTMLMSDVCGAESGESPVAAIDLTFDDQSATGPIPADAPCSTATYSPLDDDDDVDFGPPPPEGPFTPEDSFPSPAPASSATDDLTVFNGSDPNGTWKLWVVDDWPTDEGPPSGQFAGGWSLDITTPDTTTTTGDSTTTTTAGGTTTTTAGGGSGGTTTTTRGGTTTTTTTPAGATTTTVAGGPTLQLSAITVAPGDTVVVTGAGLPPNAPLQINFLSDPVRIGGVTTNASGGLQTTVTIPADAAAGAHQINVTDSGGRVLAAANLSVVRSTTPVATGTLARTGYRVQAMIVLATGLILVGYVVFSAAPAPATRRRPRRW